MHQRPNPIKPKEKKAAVKQEKKTKIKKLISDTDSAFNKLTDKEKSFVMDLMVNRSSKTQAAYRNYNCKDMKSAASMGNKISKRENIITAIEEIYNEYGVNRQNIAKAVARGLNAKKTAYDSKAGAIINSNSHDHKVQLEAAKLGMDMLGDREKKRNEDTKLKININVKESDEMEGAVKSYLEGKFGKKEIVDAEIIEKGEE